MCRPTYLKNNPAEFHPDVINDGALGYIEGSHNKNNNKNKMSSNRDQFVIQKCRYSKD